MSDVAIAEQSNRQIGRREASKPMRVTGRLKQALDMMVWNNATDYEAAIQTGMTLAALRLALQRPHVRSYFRSEHASLRERENPRNTHTLLEVRDQTDNQMARVQAVRTMMAMDEQVFGGRSNSANTSTPGVVIVIQGAVTAHERAISAKPLIEQTSSQVQTHHGSMSNDSADGE